MWYTKTMNQNGNAIFIILISVALFAALAFAFSSSTRTSTSFISDEQAKAYAHEIIAYGNDVKTAVKRLQLRGCSDTDISFENNIVVGYTNINAPDDKSCDVFDVNGGGISLKIPPDSLQNLDVQFNNFRYVGTTNVIDIGTIESDLILFLRTGSKNICNHVNALNHTDEINDDSPIEGGIQANSFAGSYPLLQTLGDDNDGASFTGKSFGCYKDNTETDTDGSAYYDFYYVLIAR